ncbi:YbbC/YhhH family protein, partial [Escherichia coli]|uniref:YbbC/YhhH family protein n=1 Tax=Escherichia coli TaxID=562 RepID=UPI0025753DDE
ADRNRSHWSTSKTPSYTKSVSWQHHQSEGKYTVRNLVKNKAIALELAEIYVKNRYGQDAAEEEKPYEITELTTSWVVEGTIHSDQIAGGVFIIEIGKNDGRILNFGHGK